jgi:hypothetical protein
MNISFLTFDLLLTLIRIQTDNLTSWILFTYNSDNRSTTAPRVYWF